MAVVFLQRVAGPDGVLLPAYRAIKFGSGLAVAANPGESLVGAQGDGEVTDYIEVEIDLNTLIAEMPIATSDNAGFLSTDDKSRLDGLRFVHSFPIAGSSSSVSEVAACHMVGGGSISRVYFVPNANSTPASGSNSQAMTVSMRDGVGGAAVTVATAAIANATPAAQFQNFSLGSIVNGTFLDSYVLTFKTVLTGTATLPSGMLFVITN